MGYLIEKNGERQHVESMDGYEGWTVLGEGSDSYQHDSAAEWDGVRWVVPISVLQDRLWDAAKNIRETLQNGVAATPYGTLQIDEASKLKLSGLIQMAMLAQLNSTPFSQDWTMYDNSTLTLDAPTAINIGVLVGQFVSDCHARSRQLHDEIFAVGVTEEGLATIDITTGWP